MLPIPIRAAKRIAHWYGYDQVVIIARRIEQGEHVTTYGIDKANCDAAARIGNYLKYKIMGWKPDGTTSADAARAALTSTEKTKQEGR